MLNACKYFIKIVYDGQGALIAFSLIINLGLVTFYHFDHFPDYVLCIFIDKPKAKSQSKVQAPKRERGFWPLG